MAPWMSIHGALRQGPEHIQILVEIQAKSDEEAPLQIKVCPEFDAHACSLQID